MSDIIDLVERSLIKAEELAQSGGDRLIKVVIRPDGSVAVGESVSRERDPREYYKRVPHPLTIWEANTRQLRRDGEEADEDATACWAAEQASRLLDTLNEWIEAGNMQRGE